eukprot:SAG31_NODE_1934_length_6875_cov_2.868506_6_plen_64_part_00
MAIRYSGPRKRQPSLNLNLVCAAPAIRPAGGGAAAAAAEVHSAALFDNKRDATSVIIDRGWHR